MKWYGTASLDMLRVVKDPGLVRTPVFGNINGEEQMTATELLEPALYCILLNLMTPRQNNENFCMNFDKPGCVNVVAKFSNMINPSVFSHLICIDGVRTYSI